MMAKCPCCGRTLNGRVDPAEIVAAIGLAEMEGRIVELLCKRFGRYIRSSQILDVVYADDIDGGPLNGNRTLSVLAHRIRHKLKPHGLTMVGKLGNGGGYALKWLLDDKEEAQ